MNMRSSHPTLEQGVPSLLSSCTYADQPVQQQAVPIPVSGSINEHIRSIRRWIALFMSALIISGLTAVPLEWLTRLFADITLSWGDPWAEWSATAASGVAHVAETYPFLFYGTDWLAFAHIVIALAFLGPYRDPVRNRWIIEWGLWSCGAVVLVSFGWAPFRDIPFFWRCVDASFGVIGAIPLWFVLKKIQAIEQIRKQNG